MDTIEYHNGCKHAFYDLAELLILHIKILKEDRNCYDTLEKEGRDALDAFDGISHIAEIRMDNTLFYFNIITNEEELIEGHFPRKYLNMSEREISKVLEQDVLKGSIKVIKYGE